jgi:hypothetical protein
MKRALCVSILALILTGLLVACGGAPPAEPAAQSEAPAENAPAEEEAAEPVEAAAPTEEESAPAEQEAAPTGEDAAEEPAAVGDMIAGRPASGTDPDTGLEINPDSVVPGVDFIVRGELVNANLTPQESPEFLVLAPSGTRFRIRPQAVADIFFEDGSQPALHEFQRGLLIQATVRQDEGAGETIRVTSDDLVLLRDD